jgi:hypothetical protein
MEQLNITTLSITCILLGLGGTLLLKSINILKKRVDILENKKTNSESIHNLIRLKHYLLENYDAISPQFDMSYYTPQECSTVGCALGWGVHGGIFNYLKDNSLNDFLETRSNAFPDFDSDTLKFLFSDVWGLPENEKHGTLAAFIKRVDYVIKHGCAPDEEGFFKVWKESNE